MLAQKHSFFKPSAQTLSRRFNYGELPLRRSKPGKRSVDQRLPLTYDIRTLKRCALIRGYALNSGVRLLTRLYGMQTASIHFIAVKLWGGGVPSNNFGAPLATPLINDIIIHHRVS